MNERAIRELEQMYMMLSEEKKKAIDEATKALQAQADEKYKSNKELLCDSCYRKIAGCQAKFHNPHPVDHCIEYKPIEKQADGDIITALCSLPKIISEDGQDYVQLFDVLKTVKRYTAKADDGVAIPNKTGEWLFKEVTEDYHVIGQCSKCKERRRIDNYCSNCGSYNGD